MHENWDREYEIGVTCNSQLLPLSGAVQLYHAETKRPKGCSHDHVAAFHA